MIRILKIRKKRRRNARCKPSAMPPTSNNPKSSPTDSQSTINVSVKHQRLCQTSTSLSNNVCLNNNFQFSKKYITSFGVVAHPLLQYNSIFFSHDGNITAITANHDVPARRIVAMQHTHTRTITAHSML